MYVVFGFTFGAILGSFVKALADRSLESKTYLGRSFCPKCKHKLGFLDLFPILSYLFLKGQCRYCGRVISKEYIVVEVIMGLLVGFLFWENFQFTIFNFQSIYNFQIISNLIFQTFFITILAIIFITDLKKFFIPDRVMIPSIFLATIYMVLTEKNYLENISAGILLGGFFYTLIILTKGKGMGGGDVKLASFMGLGLGLYNGILAVMLAFFLGAIFGLGAMISGRKKLKSHLPFGPFLVIGSLIALFWGNQILDWYLQLN